MPGARRRAHFTRGEKCIFVHLVGTFALLLALVVTYFAHLCLVRHAADEIWRVARRRSGEHAIDAALRGASERAGAAWVRGARRGALCGCVLVRRRWSAAPAHCVAARSDPALARLLPAWALRYQSSRAGAKPQETAIIRSIVHSHFNKDDYRNNIGLFEHADSVMVEEFPWSDGVVDDAFLRRHAGALAVLGWQPAAGAGAAPGSVVAAAVAPVYAARCRRAVAALAEPAGEGAGEGAGARASLPRAYELCALLRPGAALQPDYGAAFVVNSEVLGFFTWGDKNGNVPLVILNLAYFKDWVESIVYD